ncbi:CHASE2 domain-containing protein [Nostoc sp. ChiSLP03a]|uniref:CHASE2 domain-containing protein n=1 Tax=Nostoc sp. ChiSLP03a TaxID=3075380 RepID=UPI002AD3F574|nr:CHASE2 domain-containing protein [Nostoc sp. ChiSLP03a]MDZ8216240.1 CHASE2 domain-containing protein [Nostoc sp. ChiSLP03a]
MKKLVVLKLDGNLHLGVQVTLEIGEEGKRPNTEITGKLPSNPDMATAIDQWQSTYRSLWKSTRIKAKKIIYDGSISQRRQECNTKASEVREHLNNWLLSESFRAVREKWLKHLMPDEEVRVLIRTHCLQLKKLPWHLWDLIDRDYPKAEVVLSVPESELVTTALHTSISRNKIRILAILGNSDGIDVEQDRQLLEKLPDATTTFLVEPEYSDIDDKLWKQPWNILFFAGHSKSEGEASCIYINKTDKLTIDELRYALRNAVANGLQLAIFNSCDGLGLARELQDLQIPQIIVMREPVPDKVAQKFLKHFLEVFSSGESIYAAVRTARQRLKGIEKEYPGASWLPVISEHPAVVSMTWAKPRIPKIRRLGTLLLLSLLITVGVLGVRHQGGLQTSELFLYDKFMRSRPQEKQDSRLLIVTVTENDLDLPEQKQRSGSLSNLALARLLDKLAQFQARTIGLDIYRAEPVQPNQASLTTRWKTDDNFFAICKVSDRTQNYPGVSPPKGVPPERQGFSDIVPDSDNVLRRHLLAMQPDNPISPCTARYALNAQLAFHYLEKKGIFAKYTPQGDLQLGNIVFKRLRSRNGSKTESQMGGYQKVDIGGYQILLNYRSYQGSPLEIAPIVTLTDVLRGKVNPEQVKDRIVLIGTTAQSFRDYNPTPYMTEQGFSQEVPGVILQAQMVSQLVSAAIDGRPLISVLPVWVEALWIWSWSVVGGAIGYAVSQTVTWRYRSRLYLLVTGGGVLGGLYILCLIFFYQGIWVPLVPSMLVLVLTGSTVAIYLSTQQGQPLPYGTLREQGIQNSK